jgi:hypothetical protein
MGLCLHAVFSRATEEPSAIRESSHYQLAQQAHHHAEVEATSTDAFYWASHMARDRHGTYVG